MGVATVKACSLGYRILSAANRTVGLHHVRKFAAYSATLRVDASQLALAQDGEKALEKTRSFCWRVASRRCTIASRTYWLESDEERSDAFGTINRWSSRSCIVRVGYE
jgi:hypothetical protein